MLLGSLIFRDQSHLLDNEPHGESRVVHCLLSKTPVRFTVYYVAVVKCVHVQLIGENSVD